MSFAALIAKAEVMALSRFGEPITLEFETTTLNTSAVVDLQADNAEPLMPGNSRQSFTLTMSAETAALVTPDWTAVVRGQRRPVLETIPAGSGLSTIWLGDAEDTDAY